MTFLSAAVTVGTTAYGAAQASSASAKAAKQYRQSMQLAKSTLDDNSAQIQNLMNPYLKAGTHNLDMLNSALDPTRTQNTAPPVEPTPMSMNPADYMGGLAGMMKTRRVK